MTLYLGHFDAGKKPADILDYLSLYHNVDGVLRGRISFKEDDRNKWRRFKEMPGREVTALQQFLFEKGFMPKSLRNGVFGYATQASIRLFQEYVRTIGQMPSMKPDGYAGSGTQSVIQQWQAQNIVSEWGSPPSGGSDEYRRWISLLKRSKDFYINHPVKVLKDVETFPKDSDSIALNDWKFDTKDVHLIGVRVGEDQRQTSRENNDLFILLINGHVFKFWGSTDPSQSMGSRTDEAFLVEGQHKYRFGWHKISDENKVYRALRPYRHGVLVYRDMDNDNSLTDHDISFGLDKSPNRTINIHWSGIGSTNFSAGCQVIAGQSYINHRDELVDCSSFAARSYSGLTDVHKKTKGAYNVFTDLILSYAPPEVDFLYYTLGRDESLAISDEFGSEYAAKTVKRMKS